MKNKLYLGVGRSVITPKIGTYLAGYRPDLVSTAINDELSATAFYFKQGEVSALLVSITVCEIATDLSTKIREDIEAKYGIKKDACILHATHTHSGPNLMGMYGWGDIDEAYLNEIFLPKLNEAIQAALDSVSPVTMAIATGESLVGINRRELNERNEIILGQNPWGSFNPKMTILSFKGELGELRANIIHYGAHGTASGANSEITRDWSGVMTDVLEAESGAVTAFVNGAEGDIGPRLTNGRTTGGGKVEYAMRLGGMAAQDAVRIFKNLGNYHTPTLKVKSFDVKIPLEKRLPLEVAREEYKKYEGHTVNIEGRLEHHYRNLILSYSNGYEDLEYFADGQSIITLGDVAFVASPYELFSEIAMRIEKHASFPHVLNLSNSNGCEGYFAAESDICRGGYEIKCFITKFLQTPVPNADWHYISQTLKNLKSRED